MKNPVTEEVQIPWEHVVGLGPALNIHGRILKEELNLQE